MIKITYAKIAFEIKIYLTSSELILLIINSRKKVYMSSFIKNIKSDLSQLNSKTGIFWVGKNDILCETIDINAGLSKFVSKIHTRKLSMLPKFSMVRERVDIA